MKMILNIDPIKSGIASIGSAMTGTAIAQITLFNANTALQHAAWTVAIIAGLVSIINGIIKIFEWYNEKKKNKLIKQKPNEKRVPKKH